MKGATVDAKTKHLLRPPYYGSFKLDGIRAVIEDGTSFSNSGKDLPSKYVQKLSLFLPDGLDGEWVYGNPAAEGCLELTKSAVMSIDWPEKMDRNELRFYIFDQVSRGRFEERYHRYLQTPSRTWLVPLEQTLLESDDDIDTFYRHALQLGYEGIVLKNPHGVYKHGRATEKQNLHWKMKPFGKDTKEAVIIGWYPMQESMGRALTNPLGLAERSYAQSEKRDVEMLGGWHVRDLRTDVEFSIGGGKGLTFEKRKELFKVGDDMIGKVLQYTDMSYGVVDKPRHPQYRGFRDKIDMTEY
jgi:DNA ligase-1